MNLCSSLRREKEVTVPPMYEWLNKKTGNKVEVIRSFSEYEVPPTKEEAPAEEDPDWERQVGGNQSLQKGWGWGKKGHW